MANLIVQLKTTPPGTPPKVDWGLYDDQGHRLQGAIDAAIDAPMPAPELYSHCYWLVPGEAVSCLQVEVSKKQSAHMAKALPFLVEDMLAQPIEEVHLVSNGRQPTGKADVWVVAQEQMRRWLALEQTLPVAQSWIPQVSLIRPDPERLFICLEHTYALVQQGAAPAILVARSALFDWLDQFALDAGEEQDTQTVQLLVAGQEIAQDQEVDRLRARFAALGREVKVEQCSNLLDYLSRLLLDEHSASVNLLQGPYRRQAKHAPELNWKLWGSAAAVCLGLYLLINLGAGWYLTQEGDRVQAEVHQHYRELFPQDKRIRNVRVQMENHIKQQAPDRQVFGFHQMLGVITHPMQQMAANKQLQMRQLRYEQDSASFTLDLDVKAVQQLDTLKQQLIGQGLEVSILSATDTPPWVKGRIRVAKQGE